MSKLTREEIEKQLAALGINPAKVTPGKLPGCIIGSNTRTEEDEVSCQYYQEGEKRAASYKNQVTLVTSGDGLLVLTDNIYRVDEIKNHLERNPGTIKDSSIIPSF